MERNISIKNYGVKISNFRNVYMISKIPELRHNFRSGWQAVTRENHGCVQNRQRLLLFSEYNEIKEVMFWQRRFVCLFVDNITQKVMDGFG